MADPEGLSRGGDFMASAGAQAYMGVWGLCPQWGPGAKPLVRGLGGAKPPKAGDIFAIEVTISCYSASKISTFSVVGKTLKIVKLQCNALHACVMTSPLLVELEVDALANLTSLSI